MTEEELYKRIVERWGEEAQLGMLQEECAELIVAVNKLFRNKPGASEMVCEELADVQNMINQFKSMYPDFEKVRLEKLERVKVLLGIPEVTPRGEIEMKQKCCMTCLKADDCQILLARVRDTGDTFEIHRYQCREYQIEVNPHVSSFGPDHVNEIGDWVNQDNTPYKIPDKS